MSHIDAALSVISIEQAGLNTLKTELETGTLSTVFDAAVEAILSHSGRVILSGIGKSGHIARKIAATLASTGTPAYFVHATEASHGDLGMINSSDVILAISKSGETRELSDLISYAKRFGITLIGMTAGAQSSLAKSADIALILPNAAEASQAVDAPTTSTTLQLVMGDCLAVALITQRRFTATDFKTFHPGGKLGAALKTTFELMHGADELPLCDQKAPMKEALLVMSERRFGCVGVTDDQGRLIGIITDGDLRRHIDGLMSHRADEVMTKAPLSIGPDQLAVEALKLMNDKRITVLFVCDQSKPVGIMHVHDLLRAGIV